MPQMTLTGVVLGLRSKPYDFKDDKTGERNNGVSHRLFLWDLANTEPIEVTVRADVLGMLEAIAEGQLVTISVEPRANGNRVTYVFQGIGDVQGQYFTVTGEAKPKAA